MLISVFFQILFLKLVKTFKCFVSNFHIMTAVRYSMNLTFHLYKVRLAISYINKLFTNIDKYIVIGLWISADVEGFATKFYHLLCCTKLYGEFLKICIQQHRMTDKLNLTTDRYLLLFTHFFHEVSCVFFYRSVSWGAFFS